MAVLAGVQKGGATVPLAADPDRRLEIADADGLTLLRELVSEMRKVRRGVELILGHELEDPN